MVTSSSLQPNTALLNRMLEPKILALGLGGAGNDLLTDVMDMGMDRVYCIAADTDRYHLQIARAHSKFRIESEFCSDAGTEGDVNAGRDAALRASEALQPTLDGVDLVFVLAGMGGGTGGGAAPVISNLARKLGALVVGVVTMPFYFKPSKFRLAVDSIRHMLNTCDTIVLIDQPSASPSSLTLPFGLNPYASGQTCCSVVSSIAQTLGNSSLLNSDGAALRSLLRRGGLARVGIGDAYSSLGPEEAVLAALRNTIPFGHISDANGIFVDIIGDSDLTDVAVGDALGFLTRQIGADVELLCGRRTDENLQGATRIHLLATGIRFPYSPSGCRSIPIDIHELEPESGDDDDIGLVLDLHQLEDFSSSRLVA
jgi:cell division protein FtsZ